MTAFLVKLQPNQDVTEGLEAAIAGAGLTRARIVAAVGSLIQGVLDRGPRVETVDGPAIEVAALSGEIGVVGDTRLYGYLCRQDSSVVAGVLLRGRNPVAVTFELLLDACPA